VIGPNENTSYRIVGEDVVWIDVAKDVVWIDVAKDVIWTDVAKDVIWIDVAKEEDMSRALVNTVIKLQCS
jgi:hypothetical protein